MVIRQGDITLGGVHGHADAAQLRQKLLSALRKRNTLFFRLLHAQAQCVIVQSAKGIVQKLPDRAVLIADQQAAVAYGDIFQIAVPDTHGAAYGTGHILPGYLTACQPAKFRPHGFYAPAKNFRQRLCGAG